MQFTFTIEFFWEIGFIKLWVWILAFHLEIEYVFINAEICLFC